MNMLTAKVLKSILGDIKDQQMTIEDAVALLNVFPDDTVLTSKWDVDARTLAGLDTPIILPMPKGRGARRG